MSVASAHAHRDTKLPDGEAHRLRFIEPLDPDDRATLQKAPASPAYIKNAAARERTVYIAGNVLRRIIAAAQLLRQLEVRRPLKKQLRRLWTTMWDDMLADSMTWLDRVPEAQRKRVARSAMDVVTGKVAWSRAEHLYDAGIVFRTADSELVRPVSTVACAVILRVMASHALLSATPLSTIPDGRERGFELERQFLGQLDGFRYDKGVPAKLLDGSMADAALDLRCSYALPFSGLADLVARDVPVLYHPTSGTYPCDGILMPAASGGTGKIFFIECSTESPLLAKRVSKVRKWFAPSGVVAQMRALHPELSVCVVLVYDRTLANRVGTKLSDEVISLSKGELLLADAGAAAASARPADTAGTAAGAGVSAGPSARRVRARKLPPADAAAPLRIGDVVRVVDEPFLINPLGLLVGDAAAR